MTGLGLMAALRRKFGKADERLKAMEDRLERLEADIDADGTDVEDEL